MPTLPTDSLRAGQTAVVRTVFSGTRIEPFEAEISACSIGGRTEGDIILARATSERVVKSGVAQGMSGSPVYVDGQLIGALSSGWPFSREPIFGITPIGEMLDVLDRPMRAGAAASAGPSGVGTGQPAGACAALRRVPLAGRRRRLAMGRSRERRPWRPRPRCPRSTAWVGV